MTVTTTPPATVASRAARVPTFAVLIGIVYAACVVLISVSVVAEIVFGYAGQGDQPRSLGEQLVGILAFGTGSLVVSVVAARRLSSSPRGARIGTVCFAVLSVPALAFFWCGMPGMFGATAAHLAGLTRDGTPRPGAARALGIVGLVLAIANPVLHVTLVAGSWILELT